MALTLVVVDIVGRDVTQSVLAREIDETPAAFRIAADEILLQLDVEVLAPEPRDVACERLFSPAHVAVRDERGHFAAFAAGERDEAARMLCKLDVREVRIFALARQVRG